nr:amino acid ABC transporter permease [uncultured Eubacterium sp.]
MLNTFYLMSISSAIDNFKSQFDLNFIQKDRWRYMLQGLGNTLTITAVAAIIGIVLGVIIAAVRSSYDKNEESLKLRGGFSYRLLKFLNGICKIYLTIIRGTPVVVQLLICYFIIFAASSNGVAVAIFAFGINSGAYVAEIFRGGIMSIDQGQFEAGRSIGFNYIQTMRYIILPQMFKTVLPTLLNEFIALLKETSVAGYVAVTDLTKAGSSISASTYSYYMPLLTVALVYLVIVMFLTKLVGILERRMRKNER